MTLRGLWKRAGKILALITSQDVLVFSIGVLLTLIYVRINAEIHDVKPLTPQAATITSPWVPDTVKKWHGQIEAMAKRYDIDPNLIAIIMTMESGGYAKANSGQAQGLMQITPVTAKDIANRYVKQPVSKYDIWDPNTNIEFGAAYLAKLRDIYRPTIRQTDSSYIVELVAAAYNGGFGAADSVEKGEGLSDTQTVVYSRDALNMWRERHAAKSPTFDRWKERGGDKLIEKAQQASK